MSDRYPYICPGQNPDTMGVNMDRTIKEWAELSDINPDTARRVVSRNSRTTYGLKSRISAEQWETWKPGQSGTAKPKPAPKKKEKSVFESIPAAANVLPPGDTKQPVKLPDLATVRRFVLNTILVGIPLGHAALVWYDCAELWAVPGQIGGGLAFFIIAAVVLLATDPTKNVTSQIGLFFALLIDAGAYWVHFPVFETYRVPDVITGVLCAFLCALSWGALLMYRHQKNN